MKIQLESRPLPRNFALLELADELLVEIVQILSWKDALRLRQTCKHLADITRTLAVWQAYARQETRQTFWLELPIETYSSEELENLILRRKGVDTWYEKEGQGHTSYVPYAQRTLRIDGQFLHESICLVPGGRWLLIETQKGAIDYYDLDSEDRSPRRLISSAEFALFMRIDLDLESETLKFNLVLAAVRPRVYQGDTPAVISVWEINLVVDEQGRGVGLTAGEGPMKRFLQEPPGRIWSLSLVGDFLAYTVNVADVQVFPPINQTYAFIVNWKNMPESDFPKRVVLFPSDIRCCLLNGFICVPSSLNFHLFSFESLPEITNIFQSHSEITLPTPTATVTLPRPVWESTISQLVVQKDITHFAVAFDDAIYKIVVQTDHEIPRVEAVLVSRVPPHGVPFVDMVKTRISISDDFCAVWYPTRTLLIQRLSQGMIDKPLLIHNLDHLGTALNPSLRWNALDMPSGKVLTLQNTNRRCKVMVSRLGLF